MTRLPTVCCTFVLLLVAAGCGGEAPPAQPTPVRWQASKHLSAVGQVRAAVIERPAPDRAWIEAQWEARAHQEGLPPHDCALEIAVPEGVTVLEGEAAVALDGKEATGSYRWLVAFPLDRPLDAVLRYCAHTEAGPRAAEVAVRLGAEAEAGR